MNHTFEIPQTIPQLLDCRAAKSPDVLGFGAWDHGHLIGRSWRDVNYEVGHLTAFLQAKGLQRGDRFVIIGKPSPKWAILHHAILRAGGVVVGIEPHACREHVEHVLTTSQARWWAVDNQDLLESLDFAAQRRMRCSLLLDPKHHVPVPGGWHTWHDAISSAVENNVARELRLEIEPTDLATIIYTSGTTGQPKAIPYTHGQLMTACRAIVQAFPQIKENDRTLCWLPLAHLFQRMMNLVAIARGVSVYFVDDPRHLIECAQQVEPAIFVGVPRFYEKLYQGIQATIDVMPRQKKRLVRLALWAGRQNRVIARRQRSLKSLLAKAMCSFLDPLVLRRIRKTMGPNIRFMISGAAPLPAHILEFFHGLGWPLLEAYGVSENVVPMSVNRPNEFRLGSVGKPMPGNEILLADDGEILVRGPGVFQGYSGPDRNASRLTPDGFYPTGDFGRFDDDGFLYLTGRKSEIIKTSTGRRHSPARIEAAYCRSGIFEHVVVFGNNRTHLVGLVAPNREVLATILSESHDEIDPTSPEFLDHPTVRKIIDWEMEVLGHELAPYERIQRFATLADPLSVARGELTPTLKIRRKRIEELHAEVIESLYNSAASTEKAVNLVA